MKKSKTFLVCATLSGSVLFSSCIGSFGLWNSLKDWNQGVSNKFVNELIFLAFHIVPVYEIAYLADVLVLNSIEFWSGSNPTASIYKPQNKMFHFCKTFCSKITLVNTIQNVI